MPFPYPFPIIFGEWPTAAVVINAEILQILRGSLSVEMRIGERSTASFTVVDTAGSASFVRGQPVQIFDRTDTRIFAGFIDTPGKARQGATGSVLYHDIVCMDNHYLADKRLVVRAYTSQTLEYIVEDILTNYLADEGITEGEIQTGPTIGTAVFNYVSSAEAFDALAERSGFVWYIDDSKKLYFIARSTNAAPWDLDMVTYRPIKGSVHLATGNPLYRNRQYIRGGKGQTSEQTETFTGDDNQINFTVGFPIASTPTVTVQDRVPEGQDVGIKGIDSGDDCYWNKGDATITFDIAPENTKTVTIVYYGEYPLISLAVHPTGAAARAAIEGGTGIVEQMIVESQHETAAAQQESAQAKIDTYCQEAQKFIYRTHYTSLLPGQLQAITYSPFGFAAEDMLIESILITAEGEYVEYEVTCITGPAMGSWTKFFASLVTRQDKMFRVGDSQLLVLLQESDTMELTEVTAIYNDEFGVSGLVNRWLNSAPIDAGSLHNIEHERLEATEITVPSIHATEDYVWG